MTRVGVDGLTAPQRYRKQHPERVRAQYRAWWAKNAEELKEKSRLRRAVDRQRNPEKYTNYARKHNLLKKYGLTRETFDALVRAQHNRCAICGTDKWGTKTNWPCVDHDHITGLIRGLLCLRCNLALGYVPDKEWLQSATEYLR